MKNDVILIFFASLIFVGLKSFQQKNVSFNHYLAIIPTSLLLACSEAYVIVKIATAGYYSIPLVLAMGLGGGTGSITATFLHTKIFHKDI